MKAQLEALLADAQLLDDLLAMLATRVGETGRSEGAREVLQRLMDAVPVPGGRASGTPHAWMALRDKPSGMPAVGYTVTGPAAVAASITADADGPRVTVRPGCPTCNTPLVNGREGTFCMACQKIVERVR